MVKLTLCDLENLLYVILSININKLIINVNMWRVVLSAFEYTLLHKYQAHNIYRHALMKKNKLCNFGMHAVNIQLF